MEPPDSSAARIPLGGKTRFAAVSLSSSLEVVLVSNNCSSLSREREAFNLAFSALMRASLKLSSIVFPKIKQPRMVADRIEYVDR